MIKSISIGGKKVCEQTEKSALKSTNTFYHIRKTSSSRQNFTYYNTKKI